MFERSTRAAFAALAAVAIASLACATRPTIPGETMRAGAIRAGGLRVALTVPAAGRDSARRGRPLDGRMLLLVSTDSSAEPRFQISDGVGTQQVFGVDVEGLQAGGEVVVDASTLGYPVRSLAELRSGEYWIQGLFHAYETFRRGDGHTVKLPPDRGEGQQWNLAPGNFYSAPRKVRLDPAAGGTLRIALDSAIPPIPDEPDTKYVKHVRFLSERLTRFWGRPTYLGAIVLLPEGYDTHPQARYPLAIYHGHFQRQAPDWRETPPDDSLRPPDLAGIARYCPNGHEGAQCTRYGYARLQQQMGYEFYRKWTGPDFPRVLVLTIQHANPYYDDSYAVNSENLGPYGDAITHELIPFVEKTYRGLGPWARALYGGSTGGWEALAAQLFYPDEYNGTWANCPDPIDFHAYTTIDVYGDTNAYYSAGPWRRTARPGERDYLGRTRSTVEDQNIKELVLGTRSRSGGQWDIWEAVFSPAGADGYPRRIWDKRTGVIDSSVAAYWREHYDLVHIMRRDWARLGPKLRGKINLNVGLSDNFFLNDAVYLAEEFLRSTTNPPADATVDYGARDEHCWSGDHAHVNAISRLTYNERFIPKMVAHWLRTAPAGADTTSWRY
jgi:hypothetical protein